VQDGMVECRCPSGRETGRLQLGTDPQTEQECVTEELAANYEQAAKLQAFAAVNGDRPASWLSTFAEFALVGATGMVVDLAVFLASTAFSPLGVARALGIAVAMTWNFFLNRQFTFAGCRGRRLWQQYLLFCASCFLGAVVNWGTSMTLCFVFDWFMRYPAIAGTFGVVAGFSFNFILSRRFVFCRQQNYAQMAFTRTRANMRVFPMR
jgi:putative flippase GtrA